MNSDPMIRASDQDRDRIVAVLGEHYATGRLTLEEFQERLDLAYAAKTFGDLDGLMADLPHADLDRLPGAWPRQSGGNPPLPGQPAPGAVRTAGGRSYVVVPLWLMITLGALAILMMSGPGGGAGFVWIVVLLVLMMLRRRIKSGASPPHEHHHRHEPWS